MVKNMKCLVFDSPKGLCKYFPSNFATKNMIFISKGAPTNYGANSCSPPIKAFWCTALVVLIIFFSLCVCVYECKKGVCFTKLTDVLSNCKYNLS